MRKMANRAYTRYIGTDRGRYSSTTGPITGFDPKAFERRGRVLFSERDAEAVKGAAGTFVRALWLLEGAGRVERESYADSTLAGRAV